MLSNQPDDILVRLGEPLLLLEAAAQLRDGRGGGPAGDPVIDAQAVAIVAGGRGCGQEPVGVGQVPRGRRRRGGRLPVLRRQAGELLGLALAPAAPAAARPVGLHDAAADQAGAAAAEGAGGGGGGGGRGDAHHHHH